MKSYMTVNQLLKELQDNKNINLNTVPPNIFDERSYTSLVVPYKRLICINYNASANKYIYKVNGDFQDYINLAEADSFIANKYSIYIESFEMSLKTFIGEILATKMLTTSQYCNDYNEIYNYYLQLPDERTLHTSSQSQLNHFSYRCYDFLPFHQMYDSFMNIIPATGNIMANRKRAIENILKLNRSSGQSANPLIQHYFDNGNIPPIWCVVHTLSLGDLLAIFNMLKKSDKLDFTKYIMHKDKIKSEDISSLSNKINEIRKIRNTINHYEPIIPFIMQYVDNKQKDTLLSTTDLIKKHNKSTVIKSPVVKRTKIKTIDITPYNQEYMDYINQIIYKLL